MDENLERFRHLTFDKFRELALDPVLEPYEKVGFPASYRKGREGDILKDMIRKLPMLENPSRKVLDIGPGCSELPQLLMSYCASQQHNLTLVDSLEMLDQLPDQAGVRKLAGRFPEQTSDELERDLGSFDAIICYSVFQYVYAESNPFTFLDAALALLAPRGALLLGDVPNTSMRKRFLSSESGIRFHQEFMQTDDMPEVSFNQLVPGGIDDAVMMALIARARSAGFHGYLTPQDPRLPMANRREDLLLQRP